MQLRTQLIIGATLMGLGLGVVALGFLDDEATVRQVADVLAAPEAHRSGDYTVIGIPQPELLDKTGVFVPNPARINATTWLEAAGDRHITYTMAVAQDAEGSTWSYSSRSQIAGQPETASWDNATWRIDGQHTVFLIQGFPDGNGNTPWIWGVYDGVVREAIQPKPSQFQGHVASELGGVALPHGAWVLNVTEFTAGCSSKFLPEEFEA